MNVFKLIVLLFFVNVVAANDKSLDKKGWYVGGGVGTSNYTVKPDDDHGFIEFKRSSDVLKLLGGYRFNRWLGLELNVSAAKMFNDRNTQLDADVFDIAIAPKVVYQISDSFNIFFKYGLQYTSFNQSVEMEDKIFRWYGVGSFLNGGVQYDFNSGAFLRFDYKFSVTELDRGNDDDLGYTLYDDEVELIEQNFGISGGFEF